MIPLSTGDPLRLGPYRLIGTLGEGGMGKVYFGRDNGGRKAAVKVLRPELAHDQQLAQRFVREARTAQAVTSAGVARVLGSQTEGGRPWIAAEFLAGPTLEEAVTAYGPLDEPGLRALAASLARTLQDIHAAQLVHRDLKPSNIVLTSRGPRVIDFGIARPEHGLTLTTTGQVPVTPGYGAPEQVLGQRVGPAADVFSLGAVLAYAAGGQRAFNGAHVAAVQYEVVHGEADLSRVPDQLRPLILPCLAKNPAQRPVPTQIAQALAPPKGAAKVWRQGPWAVEIARRESTAEHLVSSYSTDVSARPTRRRMLTALAVGGTVLAAGAGTTAWWLKGGPDGSEPRPVAVPPAVEKPSAAVLSATEPFAPLWGPVRGASQETPSPLPVRDVVVFNQEGGGLAAHRVTDGSQRWLATGAGGFAGFLSVADRLVVAADTGGALQAFIASTGEKAWTASGVTVEKLLAADADTVYVMTKERHLSAVSVATRKALWSVPTPVRTSFTDPPAAAVGAGRLVLFASDGLVVALDTANGRKVWGLPDQGTAPLAPAIVKDRVYFGGRTLAAHMLADGKKIWSVEAETRVEETSGGWGPPAVRGDEVYAVDDKLYRRRASDGKKEWMFFLRGYGDDPRKRPVVQGGTVWIVESSGYGLTAVSAHTGDELSLYTFGDKDAKTAYEVSGDGNRLFAAHAGSVVAMPVRP
ncbi:PQQ-binding-like beta-propeller repeat protein [Streptomyces sp. NPDC005283]|uniref:protein kinase domain-containing protein n=1 Tax=Streptomyces sp. NPDC005283 TaxID=3156871 RepID=UPI0034542230